jgi:hypothetical protein
MMGDDEVPEICECGGKISDGDLTIPTFLRRGHPDCIVGKTTVTERLAEELGVPLHKIELRDEFREGPTPSIQKMCKEFVDDRSIGEPDEVKRKLTGAFRSRVAMAVIAQVRRGADTFGKIRKALPEYDDRELKSGIRYAEKWMPMLERRGSKRKPIMHQYQARLERDGRRYRVVTY